jgi:hypothetical protein
MAATSFPLNNRSLRRDIAIGATCLLLALTLSGCGEKAPAEKKAVPVPWQPQLDALEKAKGVEGELLDADRKRREEIDKY